MANQAQTFPKAVVFDLDGVITLTASVHERAWKALFDAFLQEHASKTQAPFHPFEADDYRRYVDGRPRYDGVEAFLASRDIDLPYGSPSDPPGVTTICGIGNQKNELFRRELHRSGVDVDPGAESLVRALRERGIRTGIATSSRNGVAILQQSGLAPLFSVVVDGNVSTQLHLKGKPEPDIFVETARQLEALPAESVVFEDAVSGVAAGRAGQFGLVVGVDRIGNPQALAEAGAHIVVSSLSEVNVKHLQHQRPSPDNPPSAVEHWSAIRKQLQGKRPAVFLDYDGTLTPIVSRPEDAVLSRPMRTALERLARSCLTVIVSGRERSEVAALVAMDSLYYAGSHGFDITGPHGSAMQHSAGEDFVTDIADAYERLKPEVERIPGATIENKRFALAIHYRNVAERDVAPIERMVSAVVEGNPRLRRTGGKKIFEVRPNIDWHKGKALLWVMEALALSPNDTVPIYIGDDETDEDAFRAIQRDGVAIVVLDESRPTDAHYQVSDVDEVRLVLEQLAEACREP